MNNITRNNYEEYFILYLDNELNTAQQQELAQFLQQNTDLQAELDMLSGTKLSIGETVVFPDKDLLFAGKLLQQTTESEVSAQDSEIIMYLDAELTASDKKAFEQKLAVSPELQQQLALFAKTKLKAQVAEVFPDKTLLYKEEETKRRIVPMYWLRMGVAAALLITLGVGGFKWLNNPQEQIGDEFAVTTIDVQEPIKEVNTGDETAAVTTNEQTETDTQQQLATTVTINKEQTNTVDYAAVKNTGSKSSGNDVAVTTVSTDVNNNRGGNNLPTPANRNDFTTVNDAGLASNTPDVKPLNNNTGMNNLVIPPPVKNNNQVAFASNNQHILDEVVEIEEPEENKKNKFRGFLRKVTRNFQKQTSIDMTNGDDQLLVAGFAFKM